MVCVAETGRVGSGVWCVWRRLGVGTAHGRGVSSPSRRGGAQSVRPRTAALETYLASLRATESNPLLSACRAGIPHHAADEVAGAGGRWREYDETSKSR